MSAQATNHIFQEFDAQHSAELLRQLSPEEAEAIQSTVPSWLLILSPAHLHSMVKRLAKQIDDAFVDKEIAIVAILSGAVYFLTDLSRELKTSHTIHFVSGSSYHDSQTQSESVRITGVNLAAEKFAGKTVLLIDELYDNGLTLDSVREHFLSEYSVAPENLFTAVALRKRKAIASHTPPTFCGVDGLPDLWFVGYGLDDCGTKRGWKGLWAIPKIAGVPLTTDDEAFFNADSTVVSTSLQAVRKETADLLK